MHNTSNLKEEKLV